MRNWGGKPKTDKISWWKSDWISLIKNFSTQIGNRRGKPEKNKLERGLKLFWSLGSSDDRFSKSTTFFY